MVVIDKEVIGDGSEMGYSQPDIPIGLFVENKIRETIAKNGDATWMVSFKFLKRF